VLSRWSLPLEGGRFPLRLRAADLVDTVLQLQAVERLDAQAGEVLIRFSSTRNASRKACMRSASLPSAAAGSARPQWAVTGWPVQARQTSPATLSQAVPRGSGLVITHHFLNFYVWQGRFVLSFLVPSTM
jgi:hypothetical protein